MTSLEIAQVVTELVGCAKSRNNVLEALASCHQDQRTVTQLLRTWRESAFAKWGTLHCKFRLAKFICCKDCLEIQ